MTVIAGQSSVDASAAEPGQPVLDVSGLVVDIASEHGTLRAVDDLSFEVRAGEVLGLVGESGSGKSITALSLLRLLPDRASITGGKIRLGGTDLLAASARQLRSIRGRRVAIVFQDPLTSLNPLMTVRRQLIEAFRLHDKTITKHDATQRATDLLLTVGFAEPKRILESYPHELSGGMRQRVVIVMAMCNSPELLIADEPTTALDVTTQSQVLDSLDAARQAVGAAMILISHDLSLVGERADRVHVMYNGRIVERGLTRDVLQSPTHPYTIGLLKSRPTLQRRARLESIPGVPPSPFEFLPGCAFAPRCVRRQGRERCVREKPELRTTTGRNGSTACHFAEESQPQAVPVAGDPELPPEAVTTDTATNDPGDPALLTVTGLVKQFAGRRTFRANRALRPPVVDEVTFRIRPGRTLALVGESGSGKSTIARSVLRLIEPTSGDLKFGGTDVRSLRGARLREYRTRAQLVQQDPYSALNPRMTVGESIGEALRVHQIMPSRQIRDRVGQLLESVGLRPDDGRRFPHEFSGGQRQRVCIARALSLEPQLLVLDEPVSSLDVSIQAQILNLLADIQRERRLAFLFITHDLAVVRNVADEVAVLYRGRLVETGPAGTVLTSPAHPYTQMLLAAVPNPERGARVTTPVAGEVQHVTDLSVGCSFRDRCPRAQAACAIDRPVLLSSAATVGSQRAACHFPGSDERAD